MSQDLLSGGAAGRRNGPGKVYIMKDNGQFKIGCSIDPERRLKEIQRQTGHGNTELIAYYDAKEMNKAETEAQQAVIAIGLVKVAQNATDWFNNPLGHRDESIAAAVKNAVEYNYCKIF